MSQCTATAKSSGQRCRRAAIAGGTVCLKHGGSAPQVKKAALERLKAARDLALEKFTGQLQGDLVDPRTALDATTRLTEQIEVLEGRAGSRVDVNVHDGVDDEIERLLAELDPSRKASSEEAPPS